jgi:hypothetical protein
MNPWPQVKFTGTQVTPTPAAWPQDQYRWRDPRDALAITAHVEQQQPQIASQPLPSYAILAERERAKLERRVPRFTI